MKVEGRRNEFRGNCQRRVWSLKRIVSSDYGWMMMEETENLDEVNDWMVTLHETMTISRAPNAPWSFTPTNIDTPLIQI